MPRMNGNGTGGPPLGTSDAMTMGGGQSTTGGPMMGGPTMGGGSGEDPFAGLFDTTAQAEPTPAGMGRGQASQGDATRGDGDDPLSALADTLDNLITDGGITLDETTADWADTTLDDITSLLESGGTIWPGPLAQDLQRLEEALDRLTDSGGSGGLGGGRGHGAPGVDGLLDRVDDLVDKAGDTLSASVLDSLTTVQTVLEEALGDGSYEADSDAGAVATASDTLAALLADDTTVKLADSELAALGEEAADLETLIDTGFLALDSDTLAALSDLAELVDSLADRDDPDALRDTLGDAIADLDGVVAGMVCGGGPGGSGGDHGGGPGGGGPGGDHGGGPRGGGPGGLVVLPDDLMAPDDGSDGLDLVGGTADDGSTGDGGDIIA